MFVYLAGWRLNKQQGGNTYQLKKKFFFSFLQEIEIVQEEVFFFYYNYKEIYMFVERVGCLTNIECNPTVY
jgi:hypothetical protein